MADIDVKTILLDGELLGRAGDDLVSVPLVPGTPGAPGPVGPPGPPWPGQTCKVYRSGSFPIPTGAVTTIVWNATELDTDGFHDGDDAQLIIPAGLGGTYLVGFGASVGPLEEGQRLVLLVNRNGTEIAGGRYEGAGSGTVGSGNEPTGSVTAPVSLAVGDVITAAVFHQRGVSLDLRAGVSGSALWCVKIS